MILTTQKALRSLFLTEKFKEPSTHLNGDEAMCFGSAFIAANSSAQFKVRKVYLTQHPNEQIVIEINPVNPEKAKP